MAGALMLASCSEEGNDDKYRSEPPLLSDITISPLGGEGTEIHVGEKFTATAEQSKAGRLLNTTTYTWSSTPDGLTHKYTTKVIYDNAPANPVDTLVASSPGTYTLTFTGKYNASGNTQVWAQKYGSSFTEQFASGNGKATYVTGGILYFTVTATKTFMVVE